jgi:hypothetical protein
VSRIGIIKNHNSRRAIEAALVGGMSCADASKSFFVPLEAVKRYRRTLPGIEIKRHTLPKPPKPSKVVPGLDAAEIERLRAPTPSLKPAPLAIEPPTIKMECAADVIFQLGRTYERSLAAEQAATASGEDGRALQERKAGTDVLRELAKAYGAYSDGVTVNNLHVHEQKALVVIAEMTLEDKRALRAALQSKDYSVLPPALAALAAEGTNVIAA